VWTPRRLLLIVSGLFSFAASYFVYSSLFGWIDGLPPLPEAYMVVVVDGGQGIRDLPSGISPLISRLRYAFGPDCVEQSYKLKFESREKGLLFAAAESEFLPDGRVRLEQMSVAIFGKGNHDLTTVHSDRAFLTFDQPVHRIDDVGSRKITFAEMHADPEARTNDPRKGRVILINNRKTPTPDDDIIFRTPGPVYYVDDPKPGQPDITIYEAIELTDRQNRPLPSQPEASLQLPTVTALGMRGYLIRDKPANAAPAPAPAATATVKGRGRKKEERKKSAEGSISGVDHIELDHQVFMNIWTQPKKVMENEPGKAPEKPADGKPEDKLLLTVQTNGPFSYDMVKDIAHFEVPPKSAPGIQEYVKVTRHLKGNQEDTLTSDFLDVQFIRRAEREEADAAGPAAAPPLGGAPPPAPGAPLAKHAPPHPAKSAKSAKAKTADGAVAAKAKLADGAVPEEEHGDDLEIDTIHAYGKSVTLSSDADSLFAYGNDLFYQARIKQTIMKGAPMHAVKNGNVIRAPEVLLADIDDPDKQHAQARGPGIILMGELDPKTQEHSQQAQFEDMLVYDKVQEQGKKLDLIILTGKAKFADTLNEQCLSGRRLKLWMLSKERATDAKPPEKLEILPAEAPKASLTKGIDAIAPASVRNFGPDTRGKDEGKRRAAQVEAKAKDEKKVRPAILSDTPEKKEPKPAETKQNPHRLEAVGDVVLTSPDLNIDHSEYLNVWFKDVPPPPPAVEPAPANAAAPGGPMAAGANAPPPIPPPPAAPTAPANQEPAKKGPAKKDKDEPPFIVRNSRRIEAWVNRIDGVNNLDKVHCEGKVVMHQDPTPDNETGVDIAGHTVDVEHFTEGNYLVVEGNDENLGQVHFDSILIVAEDIRIDQRDSTANVKGPGSMRLRSKTDLDGKELETPTFVDVFWNDAMDLDGPIQWVRYEGAVTARQGEKKVICETMQVWLDRPLYLNQTSKPKSKKKVDGPQTVNAGPPGQSGASATITPQPKNGAGATQSAKPGAAKKNADDDESPKIRKVLCDQQPANPMGNKLKRLLQVSAEDIEKENGALIKYQHVLGLQIEMDNVENKMTAWGPGTVRMFQPSSSDPVGGNEPPPKQGANGANGNGGKKDDAKKDDEEMKLTWISFDQRMIADNTKKRAMFYSNIELVNMPSDRHDAPIDIAKLPPRALYLRCHDNLEMTTVTRKALNKKGETVEVKHQEMKATGNVRVRNDDFEAWSQVMTYAEDKSLLVFIGTRDNPAVMNKSEIKGGERKTFRGQTIRYNLKTKDFSIDGSVGGGIN
jgi:hypothetical protein